MNKPIITLDDEKIKVIELFHRKNKFSKKLNFNFINLAHGYCLAEIKNFEPNMLNSIDCIHGGIIASILDSAMSIAANTINKVVVTRSLNVNYIEALQPIDIKIEAEVLTSNNKTVMIEAKIYKSENTLIANATGVFNTIARLW